MDIYIYNKIKIKVHKILTALIRMLKFQENSPDVNVGSEPLSSLSSPIFGTFAAYYQ